MSLRWRLTLGLVALLVAGLASFGIATYFLYAPSLYQRLDDQLRASVATATDQLQDRNHLVRHADGTGGGPPSTAAAKTASSHPPEPGPSAVLPPGTYAVILTPTGKNPTGQSLQPITFGTAGGRPKLPTGLENHDEGTHFLTVESRVGSGEWRVLWTAAPGLHGDTVVIAVPTTGIASGLHRLLLIEAGTAAALLAVMLAVSWVILRRGLRPLEDIATQSRAITGGDLSRRVGADKGPTEIVALGSALNVMLEDIERAFAEREATEARLRQFLADASHELRTPLTSIQGFAELFRLGVDSEHVDDATIMRRIEDEAARMKRLVEDLLTLARLDQHPETEVEQVDLSVIAADACSDAVAAAPDRPVSLDAPAPLVVLGDPNHLRQALGNLVTNAIRHTPDGTPIEVAARRDGDRALLVVRDHGPGLESGMETKVFERFWQADAARAGSGVGLGLAIVAAIALEHGGSTTAANAADGGALFTLSLPVAAAP